MNTNPAEISGTMSHHIKTKVGTALISYTARIHVTGNENIDNARMRLGDELVAGLTDLSTTFIEDNNLHELQEGAL